MHDGTAYQNVHLGDKLSEGTGMHLNKINLEV